jgi:hypothetical protein
VSVEEDYVKVKKSDLKPITKEEARKWRQLWWRKLFENFVSVKVWVIFLLLFVSAVLCYKGKVSSEGFVSVNGTVISIVFGLREGFKVAKVKNGNGEEKTWV